MFCGILLPWGRDDSSWRWDRWRLSYRIVLHRGWFNLNDIGVHAVSRGDFRLCYHADECSVLGQLRCGILLPIWRDDINWRRDRWRLSDWIILHRGWCNLNDICVHAVPRRDFRLCYHADDRSVLWRVHSRMLLPPRLRLRQWRNECWHMHDVPKDV